MAHAESVAGPGARRLTLEGGVETIIGRSGVMRIDDGAPRVEAGEVRFSVPHRLPGHPFVVRAEGYRVVVVGTRFGISVQEAGVLVDVEEGIVEVWESATQRPLARLTPGESWQSPPREPAHEATSASPAPTAAAPSAVGTPAAPVAAPTSVASAPAPAAALVRRSFASSPTRATAITAPSRCRRPAARQTTARRQPPTRETRRWRRAPPSPPAMRRGRCSSIAAWRPRGTGRARRTPPTRSAKS